MEAEVLGRSVRALPKPVIRQLLLLFPVSLDVVVHAARGSIGSAGPGYFIGALLLILLLVLTVAVRREPFAGGLGSWLPLLDLAALAVMCADPNYTGVGILAILPAMWLGSDRFLRGVLVSMLSTVAMFSLPVLVLAGPDTVWWTRALMLPLLVGMCSLTVAGMGQIWVRQNHELEEQGGQLARALDDVLANRALNDAIVGTVDVGLVALDREGSYQSINPPQARFMALAFPQGHAGHAGQLGDVFAADRVTRLATEEMPTARAKRGEEFDDHRIWVGADPAKQLALSVSARCVRDAAGDFDGAVLVYKDVTPLMAALKVKDDFVASVSHELRTPLTSIMGFLDLVLDEEETVEPGVRRKLEVAKRNSERLLALVSDLLLAAQADEGYIALDVEPTDMSSIVQDSVSENAGRAREQGLTVRRSVQPGLVVPGDPVRLRQIVDNLVSNAVKHTPSGGTVSVVLEGGGCDLWLKVTDTGIGIAPDDLGKLFMQFFRSREAQDRAIQGIGLGLAITRSIVEAHGGTILVESEPGRGSTFIVRLPLEGPQAGGDAAAGRGWGTEAG